jgi:xanthine dehydrogenase molybdenum-binding subunit
MGGGFGGKGYTMRHIGMAVLLSKKTGKPVRFVGSKEDEFQRCNTRHPFLFHIKTGVKNDGTLTAMHVESTSNTGAYFTDALGAGAYVAIGAADLFPYHNFYWKQNVTYTNCPNAGAYRGYGNLQGHHAIEQHMDIMAERIGMDPLEFRKKNHIRAGDFHGVGSIMGSEALDECIDKGAQAIGWQDKWKGFGQPYSVNGSKKRGVGMASAKHDGAYGYDSAIVKIMQDGTVQLITGTNDIGQGSDTVLSQTCAEAFKVKYDEVSIVSADTATTPWCTNSVASSQTCTCGNAVKLAAEDALGQLFDTAATIMEVNPEDLDTGDGIVFVKANPDTNLTFAEILQTVAPPVIVGFGRWAAPADYAINGFAAQFADVEVDVDTGGVKVLKMALAHDVGRAVNPNALENQIEGGVASQGIGLGVLEDFHIDRDTGKPLNPNYLDYTIATTLDVPEMETILVESNEPRGPFGAKGCSEICIVPTGPAIANAIYNAIGARITEYPCSPDKILKALGKA